MIGLNMLSPHPGATGGVQRSSPQQRDWQHPERWAIQITLRHKDRVRRTLADQGQTQHAARTTRLAGRRSSRAVSTGQRVMQARRPRLDGTRRTEQRLRLFCTPHRRAVQTTSRAVTAPSKTAEVSHLPRSSTRPSP